MGTATRRALSAAIDNSIHATGEDMQAPRQRGLTLPDGSYGIGENLRRDVWGTGDLVVHEDEWTVEQAAQAPQERNRVGIEGNSTVRRHATRRNQPRWVKRMALSWSE